MMLLRCNKVAVDADERRRSRENQMVDIRMRKRHIEDWEGLEITRFFPSASHASYEQVEGLFSMVSGVLSNDNNLQLEATTRFRKSLSIEQNPLIEGVIQSGVVPQFVEFLTREDLPQLQFEAAWGLTNIAYGSSESTKVVIGHRALPIFVKLLGSSNDDVREQAVFALGVVAGDSPTCRDLVLGNGALVPLLKQLKEDAKLSMLRNATWTLSNFCGGNPQPSFEQCQVIPTIKTLKRLLHYDDEEVLTHSCWALSYLSNGHEYIDEVTEVGVSRELVELLIHPTPSVLFPALQTIGNVLLFGDQTEIQVMLDHGALEYLLSLLTDNPYKSVKKETCFAFCQITDGNGNVDQIQAVINARIIGHLVQLIQTAEVDNTTKAYAAQAISNAAAAGSREQIEYLVSKGCIKVLCDLLLSPEPGVVTVCLKGLIYILEGGIDEKVSRYAPLVEEAGGLEKIDSLLGHDNPEIVERVCVLRYILLGDMEMLLDYSPPEISEVIPENLAKLFEDYNDRMLRKSRERAHEDEDDDDDDSL